jgi:putative transposase
LKRSGKNKRADKRKEAKAMQLTERHVIDRDDPRYEAIDKAAFASKNLYNASLYIVRQIFTIEGEYLNYNTMDKIMQKHQAYRGLPTKVAQAVVKQVHEAWVSYFEACKEIMAHDWHKQRLGIPDKQAE